MQLYYLEDDTFYKRNNAARDQLSLFRVSILPRIRFLNLIYKLDYVVKVNLKKVFRDVIFLFVFCLLFLVK